MARLIEHILLIEDRPSLAQSLAEALRDRCDDVRTASTVKEASALLHQWSPDLVVLDFALPDGNGHDVLELLHGAGLAPVVVVISGAVSSDEAFQLARHGAQAFLPKPFDLDTFEGAVERALSTPPALEVQLRHSVGLRSLKDVESEVREVMTREALDRAQGSRRGAARLLDISRQALQYILRSRG